LEVINKVFKDFFDNKINYDVCMLSGNVVNKVSIKEYNFIEKIIDAYTTSGYMINKKFANKLHENYVEGEKMLENGYNKLLDGDDDSPLRSIYAIDQYWKPLQKDNNWFVFNPKLGIQGDSYSDIVNINVSYNVFTNISK